MHSLKVNLLLCFTIISTFFLFINNVHAEEKSILIYNSPSYGSYFEIAETETDWIYIYGSSHSRKILSKEIYPYISIGHSLGGSYLNYNFYFSSEKLGIKYVTNSTSNMYFSEITDTINVVYGNFGYSSNYTTSLTNKTSVPGYYAIQVDYSNYDIYDDSGNLVYTPNPHPALKYKMAFNSGESAEDMKKVVVTFNTSDSKIIDGEIRFKLHYGSNDYSDTNIPVFSHYKIYGKERSVDPNWKEIPNGQQITLADGRVIEHKITDIESTYDYISGVLADASYTVQFNIPSLIQVYEEYMIEFYFDNTNNYFLNLFDSLEKSTWKEVPSYLADYVFYYFPPQYRYAFISSDQEENSGKIYFPMNHYENPSVRMRAFLYDYTTNYVTDRSFDPQLFDKDDYFYYFDFSFKYSEKRCLALTRKKSKKYYSYYDQDFLNNYFKLFPDTKLITDSEMSYFYVPYGYSVSFGETTGRVNINTPDGWISPDVGGIIDNNDYTELEDYSSLDSAFSSLTKFVNSIQSTINIYSDLLSYGFNNLNVLMRNFLVACFIVFLTIILIKWIK